MMSPCLDKIRDKEKRIECSIKPKPQKTQGKTDQTKAVHRPQQVVSKDCVCLSGTCCFWMDVVQTEKN